LITVDGKDVFTELAELVAAEYTALVVIDMQRDFVEPEGLFGGLGIDISAYGEVRPAIAHLRAEAAAAGVLIVHVQNSALPDRMSDSPSADPIQHADARGGAGGPPAPALHRPRHPGSRVRRRADSAGR